MDEGALNEYILVNHGFSRIRTDLFKTKMPTPQSRRRKLVVQAIYVNALLSSLSLVLPLLFTPSHKHTRIHTVGDLFFMLISLNVLIEVTYAQLHTRAAAYCWAG